MKLVHPILNLFLIAANFCYANTSSDTSLIRSHLTALTKTQQFRNHENVDQLNQTADYIHTIFSLYSGNVSFQEYQVNNQTYKNVIGSFGPENAKRIVIGAHYDVCGSQEGADDNASGVAGLLELARLLKHQELNYRVDLVAYTLEEPPFFRTQFMGSYIHAKELYESKTEVMGMVSLEMIGYFKDEKHSQSYPVGVLSFFYGNKGNYITLIRKFGAGKFARQFSRKFRNTQTIRTKTFTGPSILPGVDFSDHLNYWKFGYSALMITDTAFYRNRNYHKATDTIETLDIHRMAKVVDGVFQAVIDL